MPDTPEPPADNIAPLLRLGLEEDQEPQMADLNATILVTAPAPFTGGSGQSGGQSGGGSRGWSPPSVAELQQALPQYEISAFIARGGMGAVYQGTQKTLKRPVAIKVLPPEIEDGDMQFAARFKHEAQAMAQLSHPNIVAVFDAGEVVLGKTGKPGEEEMGGGVLLYFVMEFIEGTDVAQLIASEGIVEPRRAIQITTAVCEALAFAHEEGIIHRDIKPSNIMLDKKGRVKVADFGLAKTVSLDATLLTGTNLAMGTPDFIAPEAMIPGIKVDQRADIYAVGVMLYQMLTGHIPRGRFELPSGVIPQMSKGFDAVVDKAMQTDRDKRYSTAMEMKKDVEAVAAPARAWSGPGDAPARAWSGPGDAPATAWSGPGDAPPDHRLATAATSRRKPLLLGTAAATLILSTAAWFLMDEPMEADSGPSLSSSPSLPLSKPSATETWINALTLETKLANQPADLTPEGLRLTGNRMMKHERAPKRDGALRMQTAFVSATPSPQLRVRNAVDDALSYTLHIGADGRSAFLKRVAKAVGGSRALGEFPLPKPLGAGEDYELELRAVGSHFTVKFNGQALGGAEDAAIAEGKFGIASASTVPVLVKTLEYLNLDGGTLSSSPSPPVSKSSAPTWRKAITRFEDLPADARTKATLRWNNGWLEPTSTTQSPPLVLLPGPKVRNGGIRVHGRMSPDIQFPTLGNVFLRRTPEADTSNDVYRVGITASPTSRVILMLANDKAKTQETLVNHPLQRTLIPGDEYELELIAIGDELHVRLNDERLRVMSDTRLKEGAMGLHCIHPMRDVEVIHLDGLSEAEARKMVGIEGRVASPQPPTGAVAPSALPGTASATKDAPFVNSLGMKFVPVPIIGGPTDGQRVLFCIWETRLQDFKTFSRETKLSFGTERSAAGPGPTHPVVTVTWDEAQAFCAWLTESERKAGKLGAGERYRLPSDHEWSCAVGIGEREDAALFPREQYRKLLDVHPWGTAWPPPERSGNFASEELRPLLAEGKHGYIKSVITGYRDGHAELAPVGSYPANALGLHDLAGNALEWCEDWFDSAQDKRVDRGAGSWSVFDRREMRSARRGANEPWSKQDAKGFRVVLALSEPASGSAAGPPAAAVPPKTVLGGPSALPKFPPGKWVKPWKNLEDIPDVRSDAEGWATLAASTAVANPPGAQGRNWGVRVWLRGLTSGTFKSPQLQLRYLDHAGYKLRVLDGAVVISRVDGDKMPDVELKRTHVKMPSPDQDCLLEFIAIGQSLHANVNGERVSLELPVNEQPQRQGEVLIYGLNQQPFRDIEVINLDGLSEAEALKIAGINVTPAAEPWQDVLRDPTKLGLTGGAERTLEGLRFAAGGHALLPAGQGPTGNGAVRMRATFGGLQVQLRARQSDATGLYQLYARENVIVLERKDTATRGSATLSLFPLRASLQPGQNYELELRVVGETFTAKLNGETLGTVTDGTYATGQFGVGVTGQDAAPALVESLEVLTLDGLPEAEG